MCGRFTRQYTWEQLRELYEVEIGGSNLQPRYNIAPTTTIDAVMERGGNRVLASIRWGLVPSWWKKKAKETPATFNAWAETVAEKPMFRAAFKRTRCIIPASGYYEWKTTKDGKQPNYFTPRKGEILSIAGLWEEWKDIETGKPLQSCTMIITSANEAVSQIHERMPVLLQEKQFEPWLKATAGTEILKPIASDYLAISPVSKRVNKTGNDEDGSLIAPVVL
jgi:putative SOS response-associated peptidase YedK